MDDFKYFPKNLIAIANNANLSRFGFKIRIISMNNKKKNIVRLSTFICHVFLLEGNGPTTTFRLFSDNIFNIVVLLLLFLSINLFLLMYLVL